MNDLSLILQLVIFSFVIWLGLYLIARDWKNLTMRLTGLGLLAYGLVLASDILVSFAVEPALASLMWWNRFLVFFPGLFWLGAIFHLLPQSLRLRPHLIGIWQYGLIPLTIILYITGSTQTAATSMEMPQQHLILAGLILSFLLLGVLLLGFNARTTQFKKPFIVIFTVTLFLGLGIAAIILPFNWLPKSWALWGIGLDFVLLGFSVVVLYTAEQGEALIPDLIHSLDFSFFSVCLFGGLVGAAIFFGTGITLPMLALLLATIAAAIAWQTLSDPLEMLVDRVALANFPQLWRSRAELRTTARIISRVKPAFDFEAVDQTEFARLTRRALSHLGDLPRLATSPLTHLPLVDARLNKRGASPDTLERAAELKSLLVESIHRLKPLDGDFGTSDEWRHYNALHYPYVIGLKPYSRRAEYNDLAPADQEALNWFRTQIPERTLYNWQNAAAKLVAQDLREKMKNEHDNGS